MKYRTKRTFLLFVILAFSFSVFSGCYSFPTFPPTNDQTKEADWSQVSDQEIMDYTQNLITALQGQADRLRIVRKSSSTIGLLAAAIATGIHGAFKADADTVTMVAGVATITPMLQQIWQAGEVSKAKEDGVSLIYAARSKFLTSVGGAGGKVKDGIITIHGATLFKEANAAVVVVRDAIAQRIPSFEDLKTATGKAAEEFKMKVAPSSVTISAANDVHINIINGYAINAFSSNKNFVTVVSPPTVASPSNSIQIHAVSKGEATVTLNDIRGGTAEVVVVVTVP